MEKTDKKHFTRELIEKYISEILVIFIGISISFVFDEWRDTRKDREIMKKHLSVLRSNLVLDTLNLGFQIQNGDRLIKSINKLTYARSDSSIADSIDFHIDNAGSYIDFNANQMAYEEIKQTAHTNLIENDSLRSSFLTYYSVVIPYCMEWSKIDETHTMTQTIPQMSKYFPVVSDSFNFVSTQEKIKALQQKELRNLLLTNAVYKAATVSTFIQTKKAATRLLKRVDDELAR